MNLGNRMGTGIGSTGMGIGGMGIGGMGMGIGGTGMGTSIGTRPGGLSLAGTQRGCNNQTIVDVH